MNEKLLEALDHISDRHIVQAANHKNPKKRWLIRAVAAALAVVLLTVPLKPEPPAVSAVELVSAAEYTPPPRPDPDEYEDEDTWRAAREEWGAQNDARIARAEPAVSGLQSFLAEASRDFLTGEENTAWSPLNVYISLSILAQTASGSTRQEILDTLGVASAEELRSGVQAMWELVYLDGSEAKRTMSNSLWLDQNLTYNQESLDILGTDYYASVHRTELSSSAADKQIRAWIDGKTGGLLEDVTPEHADLFSDRVMSIISTAYVCDNWMESFNPAHNTADIFHGPGGDRTCTFMNGLKEMTKYCLDDRYTAVSLYTMEGCNLWLVLPDEDSSVEELVESGAYLDAVFGQQETEQGKCQLSMPKFDISATLDLTAGLKKLGIREAFSPLGGDFSETLSLKGPIYVDDILHSVRFIADEQGIRAASSVEITVASMGISEPIQITLDRPFLFVLTYRDIPLFTGVVNEPQQ